MAAYDRLYYNRVDLVYDGLQIRVAPNFLCPVCGGRPEALLATTWNCNLNKALEINGPITYTMPCCQTPIHLYVGVHKEKGLPPRSPIISVEPIPADWWSRW